MKNNYQHVAVVILAGGKSERAEKPKGLRKIDEQYWIDILIKQFKSLGIDNIFIGLGHDHQKYLEKSIQLKTVNYFINQHPQDGSFSTLKWVISKIHHLDWKQLIIVHIDHAMPSSTTLEALLNSRQFDVSKPVYDSQSGHPIIISHYFADTLIKQPNSSHLNLEIRKLDLQQINWVTVNDPAICINMNTHEQWLEYASQINN